MSWEDDDDDDDDEQAPSVDTSNFVPSKSISFGLNRGRSAPSQRKAMGTSGSSSTSVHVCTNCGSEFVKWMGRCPTCREWNTLQEFKVHRGEQNFATSRPTFSSRPQSWLDGTNGKDDYVNQPIRVTDVYKEIKQDTIGDKAAPSSRRLQVPADQELNNVLGGGIMSGSLTLLGGDPGVGKSTLLLQTAGSVAALSKLSRGIGMGMENEDPMRTLGPVWYVSGEENAEQIASRAARLGILEKELWLLTETHVDTLAEQVVASYQHPVKMTSEGDIIPGRVPKAPALIVIDSIQTMVCEAGGASTAGGVTQVGDLIDNEIYVR
jgi:DNA repair protein RadA/Sms